jgi:hypothetical protein
MMERCKNAARYKGIRKPKCNGGRGCRECIRKHREWGEKIAAAFGPMRQPLHRIRSARKRAADLRRVRAAVRQVVRITSPLREPKGTARFREELRRRADIDKAVRRILDGGLIRPTYMHPVLGAPYGLPGSTFTLDPNFKRGGLWGYAHRMQADDLVADGRMTKEEAAEALKKFRLAFPKLVKSRESRPICAACKKPIDGAYASIGGNIVPYIPAKIYHVSHVPSVSPDPYVDFARQSWGSIDG